MVVGPGTAEMTGAVVSSTLMVWLLALVLPVQSTPSLHDALPISCGQAPGVVTSAKVRLGAGSQASVAVGVAKDGVAAEGLAVGPGTAAMTGAGVSSALMVWLLALVLPVQSLAVQVRVTL